MQKVSELKKIILLILTNNIILKDILYEVANMIGAQVLNVSKQDYHPQGASVTMLLAENERKGTEEVDDRVILGHLDKSFAPHVSQYSSPVKG